MFEVDRAYHFRMMEWGVEQGFVGRIIVVQMPHIRVAIGDEPEIILNTVSTAFISAKPIDNAQTASRIDRAKQNLEDMGPH